MPPPRPRHTDSCGCLVLLAVEALAAARAKARHRLSRVPWVGVARQVVVDRRQNRRYGAAARARGRAAMEEVINPDDFFAHQARAMGAGLGRGGVRAAAA